MGWYRIAIKDVFNGVAPEQALGTKCRFLAYREDEVVVKKVASGAQNEVGQGRSAV